MMQLLVILGLILPLSAFADSDNFKSLSKKYAALEQAQECHAIQSVLRKAKAQLENLEVMSTTTKELMVQREQKLSQCGAGLDRGDSRRDLAQLAEQCPNEYMDYMAPGLTQMGFQDELEEAGRSVKALSHLLQTKCNMAPESASF